MPFQDVRNKHHKRTVKRSDFNQLAITFYNDD